LTPARALTLGLALTATAGFVDAVGFIALGGFYTSFMSGNTTQLGTGIVLGRGWALALPAGLLVLFFLGSFLGQLVSQSSRRWGPAATLGVVVIGIAISLAQYFVGVGPAQSMLALAAAAGAQNAVLQPIGAARLGTTFVTGTLFAAGQDLARATAGLAPPWRWLQHLLVWASLCTGALIGGLAYEFWQMTALLIPAAVYLVCLGWFAIKSRIDPAKRVI
jgi:uncharacterized membrane protein YoaK (UPF0700 family)